MLSGHGWKLGRIGGVEVKIDPSWSIIALLVGYSFYLSLGARFTHQSAGVLIGLATVMALIFFASVLLHELAHSWLAISRGVEVKGITLFLFGGATEADLDTKKPSDEFFIAVVGPVTSLLLGGLFWIITVVSGSTSVGFAAGYLGWINGSLAVFNLLPGFPLDGGRVLRSLVWRRTSDLVRATRVAARAGRILGSVIIAIGVFEVFFLGALISGLWLVAIGWFLTQAAASSFVHLQVRTALQGVPASRLMAGDLVGVPAGTTVQEAVDGYFMRHNYNSFPVTSDHRTLGLVTMKAVRDVARDRWNNVLVDEILEPLSDMCTVGVSDDIGNVVDKLMQGQVGRVAVVDDGEMIGLITPRDVVRWLELTQELGESERRLRLG